MKKKFFYPVCAVVLSFSIVACGGKKSKIEPAIEETSEEQAEVSESEYCQQCLPKTELIESVQETAEVTEEATTDIEPVAETTEEVTETVDKETPAAVADGKLVPKTVTISGPMGQYFEVVDKKYEKKGLVTPKFEIELKRNDKPFAFDEKKAGAFKKDYQETDFATKVGFGFRMYDANGYPTKPSSMFPAPEDCDKDWIKDVLKCKPGKTVKISWSYMMVFDGDPVSFEINSAIE